MCPLSTHGALAVWWNSVNKMCDFFAGQLLYDNIIFIKCNYVSGPMFLCQLKEVDSFKVQTVLGNSHTVVSISVLYRER
jgi:hypothetical protein